MGGGSWSNDFYEERRQERAKTGTDAFTHNAAVSAKPVNERSTHALMNPLGVNRESRDSIDHPESLPVAFMLDVTGSMQSTPRVYQAALPKLMEQLNANGILHPQILFGAIGDAYSDRGPLQVGQFESDIRIDETLGNMWLEGNGGGSGEESYELALYFLARHTLLDSFEKRNKKGYLFITGDELPYPVVSKTQVAELIGDSLEADIPIKTIVEEVQQKYHVHFLIPAHSNHGRDARLLQTWRDLLGAENVVMLEDESTVCERIGQIIGLAEGTLGALSGTATASGSATVRL